MIYPPTALARGKLQKNYSSGIGDEISAPELRTPLNSQAAY
jgi:hypothetical protein